MMLGGRAAETLVLHDSSAGASNDIQRATDLARSMVVQIRHERTDPGRFPQWSEKTY